MSSRISRWNLSSLAMAASRASSRRAICSRWTRSVVRVNSTRQPFSTRAKPRAAARWLLPPPGGPNNSKLAPLFSHASPAASAMTWALLTTGTTSKSKVSRVLPGGSRASARWRSRRRRARSAISCSANAARKRPAGQPSLSAWVASEAQTCLTAGSRSSARSSSMRAALGVYDVYRGSADAAIANAVQVPVNDPLLLIPAMAYVTRNLGFGVTCAVSYEHPYTLARRFSTLDHLTGGRIGWNVVTGYLNSAAKGIGLARQPEHDTRYEIAEEYMQIVYQLWEGSWEDGAVLRDRARRVFARPDKVHRIRHDGTYFQIEAIHLCEPSPQRTPLIYQAGASSRGRQFAATHAECVFINGPSKQVIAPIVADIRRRAAAAGRNPAEILIFHDADGDHR